MRGGKTILEGPALSWRESLPVPRGLPAKAGWPLGRGKGVAVQLDHLQYPSQSGIPAFLYRTRDNSPLQSHVPANPRALEYVHTDLGVSLLVLKAQERLCGVLGHVDFWKGALAMPP